MAKNTLLQNAKYNHTKNVTEVEQHAIYLNALVNFLCIHYSFQGVRYAKNRQSYLLIPICSYGKIIAI